PPRPGEILPPFIRDMLNLTPDQKKQLDDLQKEVDAKLAKILTDQQMKHLKEFKGPKGKGGGKGPPDGKKGDGKGPPDGKGPRDGLRQQQTYIVPQIRARSLVLC